MAKEKCDVGRRAWNILRMALLWARKDGVFNLRVVPKFMKKLVIGTSSRNKINYFERELSFDKTPIIHFKMNSPGSSSMRFHLPCFNAQVDLNDDGRYVERKSFDLKQYRNDHYDEEEDEHCGICEEKSIDDKAEEFITNFYDQLKLQRQISYLHYN